MATEELICNYSGLPSISAYADIIEKKKSKDPFSITDTNRIIEMAWEDRTPFEAIKFQFGISESEVKVLMKANLKFSSYKLWRKRVESCKTKHSKTRNTDIDRFKCNRQRAISANKVSKR